MQAMKHQNIFLMPFSFLYFLQLDKNYKNFQFFEKRKKSYINFENLKLDV